MMGKSIMERSHVIQYRLNSAHTKLGDWFRKRLAERLGKDAMLRKRWGDTLELSKNRVFEMNEHVMARFDGKNKFYPATIIAVHDNADDAAGPSYNVEFNSGDIEEDVLWTHIRRTEEVSDDDDDHDDIAGANVDGDW
jgi:hypothetical protein